MPHTRPCERPAPRGTAYRQTRAASRQTAQSTFALTDARAAAAPNGGPIMTHLSSRPCPTPRALPSRRGATGRNREVAPPRLACCPASRRSLCREPSRPPPPPSHPCRPAPWSPAPWSLYSGRRRTPAAAITGGEPPRPCQRREDSARPSPSCRRRPARRRRPALPWRGTGRGGRGGREPASTAAPLRRRCSGEDVCVVDVAVLIRRRLERPRRET